MSVLSHPAAGARGSAAAYADALLDALGSREPFEVLPGAPNEIERLCVGLDDHQLRRPEAPGKWSMLEVVQHLADSDLATGFRIRMIVAHDRPTLTGYDQDRWADRLAYRNVALADALAQLRALRVANLRLARSLPAEAWKRVGTHEELGDVALELLVRLYAGHDVAHLRQLRRIRESVL